MKIGSVRLTHGITLAPMEEHTNPPLRLLMKQHGASLVCTERIDAVDVAHRDRRALKLLQTSTQESPRAGQISGADPQVMAEAARVVEELGFDIVDLNFECPIRRLCQRGEGGALMSQPTVIADITAAVVKAVSIPVTLKLRTGPNPEQPTAIDIARRVTDVGAAGLIVHARSVEQGYVGGPDWSLVAQVKQAVSIPVIGSGGVREPADAVTFLTDSGADGVAIGRGCLGNPWLFQQTIAALGLSPSVREPRPSDRSHALLQLVEGEFRYYGSTPALRRLARTSCYFAKFLPNFGDFRAAVQRVRDLSEFRRLVREYFGT